MWGDSHQLQSCPKLPISKKVEVLMKKFDATGVIIAQPLNVPICIPLSVNDSWVIISPKKRVKSMIQARTKRTPFLILLGRMYQKGIYNPPLPIAGNVLTLLPWAQMTLF